MSTEAAGSLLAPSADVTSVLIVDDEPAVRDVVSRWVASFGLRPHSVSSAEAALAAMRASPCDLAVVDVVMPGHNGLWLAAQLRRQYPETAVVLATADVDALDAERPACVDLLVKPFQRDRLAVAMARGREWRRDLAAERRWIAQLAIELRDNTAALRSAFEARLAAGENAAAALAAVAAGRVPWTMAHSERVVRFAAALAREFGLDGAETARLERAARFHDIGKAPMPLALLTKPSPLSEGERALMQRHVDLGADLLEEIDGVADAAPLVRASHEWFGGAGYPRRLAGDAIPRGSRFIAVADAYDAMTQDRSYRRGGVATAAVNELLRCCPAQFDPEVVDAFLRILSRH